MKRQVMNLSDRSYAYIKTHGGREVFVIADKDDDETDGLATLARFLEGIESDPGQQADLTAHGVSEWSVGTPAIEAIQETLRGL
jgi:hypothetical protein